MGWGERVCVLTLLFIYTAHFTRNIHIFTNSTVLLFCGEKKLAKCTALKACIILLCPGNCSLGLFLWGSLYSIFVPYSDAE